MRYAKRRDNNHKEITQALRQAGFEVIDFASAGHSIPDLLAIREAQPGDAWICWVEVKDSGGRLREGQKRFQSLFEGRGEWYEARDPYDTVCALQALYLQRDRK